MDGRAASRSGTQWSALKETTRLNSFQKAGGERRPLRIEDWAERRDRRGSEQSWSCPVTNRCLVRELGLPISKITPLRS